MRLCFDIETDDIRATRIHCLVIKDVESGELRAFGPSEVGVGLGLLTQASLLIGHNIITYDLPVIERITGVKLADIPCADTLVLSRLGNPERPGGHSLDSWGESLGFPKIHFDAYHTYTQEMLDYCINDVELNTLVWKRLERMYEVMPKAVSIEMGTAKHVYDMCQRGVTFDEEAGWRLLAELLEERDALKAQVEALLPTVYKPKGQPKSLKRPPNKAHWAHGILEAGSEFQELRHVPLQMGSRQDIASYFIRKYGWRPTQRTATGQPMVNDEILRGLPWPEAEVMADYFSVDKLLGYLNNEPKANGSGGGWLQHARGGKLHANFIPLTAVTGRPSCTSPNLQQVSTDKRARRLFGPRDGWVQVGVDADGQELRCLGHYLSRYDGGAYAKEVVEGDIHSRVQEMIGFETRNGTKPVEYGLIYGAGNEKLGLISLKDKLSVGKKLTRSLPAEGKRIRKAILDGIPGFESLLEDVKFKAKEDGRLRGLDGRTLWVRSPHSALNLLLQSAGIIHMKATMVLAEERLRAQWQPDVDYGLILWVHDELQYECRPEIAGALGELVAGCVADAAENLGFRLPMSGSYTVGSNWAETH